MCFNSSLSSCTVCSNDSSTIYYKWIGATVCSSTMCPDGQFISLTIHNWCQPCSPICVTCSSTAENCTSSTCAQNYFFLNNSCLISCPNGYYADSTVRRCLTCETGCATCFASGNSSCTVCSSSFYLQIGSTTCSAGCNSGEFQNTVGNVCTKCVSACATCTSFTVCQSCQSVNGIAYYLDVNKCTVLCPSYQFGNLTNNQCTNCADGCLTCFGPTSNDCRSCNVSSLSVNFYLIYNTNSCNQTCPNGQYANSSNFRCMLCNANCMTCVNTSSTCLTCGFSAMGANLYLFGSSCLLTCPNGYFANSVNSFNFTCDLCHFGCATCNGPFLTNCTVCSNYNNSGTITPYYKVLGATLCDTACPTGQFIPSSPPNVCAYCDRSCISCSIAATNCTVSSCSSGYFYFALNSSCLLSCPNNYYANTTSHNCTQCEVGCQLCFGGSLNECTQCQITAANISFFKVIDVNTCNQTCPPGQYPYPLLLSCRACHSSCLTCNTSDIDCQTCNNITGIPYFYYNNRCLLTCPAALYGEVSNNTCTVCPTGCSLCFGASQSECTKCTTSDVTPYFLVFGTTNCSTSCPPGQFSSNASNSCFMCDPNCNTCVDTSTYCLTCTRTSSGIRLFL